MAESFPFLDLPEDLKLQICSFVHGTDVLALALTCRANRELSRESSLWLGMIFAQFGKVCCHLAMRICGFNFSSRQYARVHCTIDNAEARTQRGAENVAHDDCRALMRRYFDLAAYKLPARELSIAWGDTPQYWSHQGIEDRCGSLSTASATRHLPSSCTIAKALPRRFYDCMA